MTITRWSPFQDVAVLNSIFSDLNAAGENNALAFGTFVPPVDIFEDEQKLVLRLEVPGVTEDAFDLRVENNVLTIAGERKFEDEQKTENYHRIERRYGSFARSFKLPQTVDTASVAANYDAGVLTVALAKREESKPRQIKVTVGKTAATVRAPKPEQAAEPNRAA